jgi:8-oxo-dGTP pyrophosphatase MutT (NUDIX family)
MKKIKKWKILEETDVSPSEWLPVFKHKVRLPGGKIVDDYFISKVGDVAMIVAVTKEKDMVFVRQYKHGTGEVIIELPAGRIREGNSPKQEAIMEIEEETGFVPKDVEPLGMIYGEPSKDTFNTYGFLMRDVELTSEQKLEITEDIEVLLIPTKEVDEIVRSGEVCASDTLACIYLTKLKYPELFNV